MRVGDALSGTAAAAVEVIYVDSEDDVIYIGTTTAPGALRREEAEEQSTLGEPIGKLSDLRKRFKDLQDEARAAGFKFRTGMQYGMLPCALPCSGSPFNNILSAHRKF